MNRWDAPDSIFAPIIAGVPPGTRWSGFGNALIAARQSVPKAAVGYNVRRGLKTTHEKRDRTLISQSGDAAKPFTYRIYLIDLPRDRQLTSATVGRLWEVGMTWLKDGLCTPAVPADYDTAMLQVNKFRLSKGSLEGAPQLALLRHLWAESVRAASPDAVVFGGQHHWEDAWWAESVPIEAIA